MSQPGDGKPSRVIRRTLADGTVKEYCYHRASRAKAAAAPKIIPGSVDAMLTAWQRSPEWRALADRTRTLYLLYARVLAPLGRFPVADVRRRHIIALRNKIAMDRGNGAATGFMRATGSAWAWAMDNDLAEMTPCYRVKPLQRGTLPAWSEAVTAAALAALPEPYRRVVVLAAYTGQRRGDLIAMTWAAYDGATIRIRQQKDRRPDRRELVIPCHAELRRELDAWKTEGRSATTILVAPRGQPWTDAHLSRELGKQVKALGLGRFTLHGLRKLAAVRLAEAGCSMSEIAAIGGWRSLSMVQLYTASASQEGMAKAAIIRLENARGKTADRGKTKPSTR